MDINQKYGQILSVFFCCFVGDCGIVRERGFDEDKQKAVVHNLQLYFLFAGDCCLFGFDNCVETQLDNFAFMCGRDFVCCATF